MLSTENAVIEILPGSANDSTAAEVYRNLQVLYATRPESRRLTGSSASTDDYRLPAGKCASPAGGGVCAQDRTV